MQSAKCLNITGMHRSGTSLVAQAFCRAGLFLGDKLKGPGASNPDGLFEDEDIIRFHDDILAVNQMRWDSYASLDRLIVPGDYASKAAELISMKFWGRSYWGWKDPRTTLFLDLWNATLPDARWVFVFRNPAQVVWSLLCRGDLRRYSSGPIARALMGLRLWTHYNGRILAFAREHLDRTLLIFAPQDFGAQEQKRVNEVILGRWSFGLRPIDFMEVYSPPLMKKTTPRWVACVTKLYLPAQVVFWKLRRLRTGILDQHPGKGGPSRALEGTDSARQRTNRVVCVISPRKFAYSETFIQAHITQLPATVKLLYGELPGGSFPALTEDGRPLLSLFDRAMDLVLRKAFRVTPVRLRNSALRRYLRKERVEAVLAEYGYTGASVSGACHAAGVPLVVHFHGAEASKRKWLNPYRSAYQEMFATAAAVIAVSRDLEQRLAALGAPRNTLFYNPCGADTSVFAGGDPAAAPPVFVAVGRFVDKKAPHLTVLAFKKVAEACPDARLIMVGDGELQEACKQLTKALHMADIVEFTGARPHTEVAALMRKVRGFVLHSVTTSDDDMEGTPVSVLEAGAAGLPVVSTRHAGIKDVVIHGETGFLVDEGDIEAMAAYVLQLVRDPDLAARLGQRARQHIDANFSMDKSISSLWNIIESVIRKQKT